MTTSTRTVRVRQGDPVSDRDAILAVLRRNLPQAAIEARQDWLYRENPCGPALVWVAEDVAAGAIVGTSAAQPRRMWVDGSDVAALDLSDFAVDAAYRTLGPAVQLLRATLEPVRDGRFAFSYDHPNRNMVAPYARVGGREIAPMRRWIRPLDLRPVLRRRAGPVVAAVAGPLANLALAVRDRARRARASCRVAPLEGPFTDEFDRLDERLRRLRPVTGRRSAAYLAWRYGRHPIWRHETLVARDGTGLLGFAVFRRPKPEDPLGVTELHAADPGVRAALADALAGVARERGAYALCAQTLVGSETERVLAALGFRPRETDTGPVVFASPSDPAGARALEPESWWMLEGDRDV